MPAPTFALRPARLAAGLLAAAVAMAAAFTPATAPAATKNDAPWSFRPVTKPAVPAVKDAAWPRDDIDRFVLARIESANLKPNRDADRATLIRRASFDLTGLPPTPAEVDAFVADRSPDDVAFAKVVDRLLASPRFGERWGRHWLDVARYADSVGRSWNAPFTYAFRYRDWVIDAFNADLPYDQFVTQQLAGDLLPAKTVEAARSQRTATGFLALGSMNLTEGSADQFRLDRIDDQIDVTTRAVMGLTVACARCHDHKYDPVSMRDYYAVAGVFQSTQTWSGNGSLPERKLEYVDANRLVRLPTAKDKGGGGAGPTVAGVHTMSDHRDAWSANRRAVVRYTTDPDLAMGATEGDVRDCNVRVKGDPRSLAPDAPPRGDVKIPGLPPLPKVPAGSSGRRELARWLTSPQHPLTARVMANRVWQHLFGRGIVRTVDDFGATGEEPTHPQLLDHLTSRFVADGWSVKRLIRATMLSRTYRLSSAVPPTAKDADPANNLFWRANIRRLEVEPIRDSMLQVAGRLSLDRPAGIQVTGTGGKGNAAVARSLLSTSDGCRTVYLPVLRSLVPEVMTTFDFPDPCQIMGQREVTTVGQQALYLLNGDFSVGCAKDAAELLLKEKHPTEADRVKSAYRKLLGRPPSADEQADAVAFLKSLRPERNDGPDDLYRWTALSQALMATAEFRYVR